MRSCTGPSQWATVPNALTSLRILLVPPLILAIVRGEAAWAAVLMAIAIASDVADGWLARLTGTASDFGAYFDPLADVVLVLSAQIVLALNGDWPLYLPVLSVVSFLAFLLRSHRCGYMTRTRLGKYVGAVLMCSILFALTCKSIYPEIWDTIAPYICSVAALYVALATLENLPALAALEDSHVF
jgi:cardiolipin synthase (CMP-forming)